MYKDKKRYNKNGYVIVNIPDHPKAFDATGDKQPNSYCVYEHVLIAEEILDRSLKEGEVVHHFDENRSNNSPDNLLVLSNPMHGKLHGWLNKYVLIPNEAQSKRMELGCVRCLVCEKPIHYELQCCSHECHRIHKANSLEQARGIAKPSKEVLAEEITQMPMTKLGEKYGVSDNGIRKWCVGYDISLPAVKAKKQTKVV